MNTLLLHPTDVLFFRDGRPIGGSLAGHGAGWPLPNVINQAIHAALWRSGLAKEAHTHRHHADESGARNRKFGSLVSAGPFPVLTEEASQTWYFPRPLDAQIPGDSNPSFFPLEMGSRELSSLPSELLYPVANTKDPSKEKPESWWSVDAWNAYLNSTPLQASGGAKGMIRDSEFADTEYSIGIGIDPATGTQDKERFYAAQYLRLKERWRLGMLASASNKVNGNPDWKHDLLPGLFAERQRILVGGQQRLCTASLEESSSPMPLPLGVTTGFPVSKDEKHLVKWILLTPAIWPETESGPSKRGGNRSGHSGGWLPNWVDEDGGKILLRSIPAEERLRRRKLNYGGEGYGTDDGATPIHARLAAAIVPKPVVVTGYAGGSPDGYDSPDNKDFQHPHGAKSTHLAVPAGAVYYFEADSEEDAERLAAALNWNGGTSQPTALRNRRSTLMGEKGFGIGVCGRWNFHPGNVPERPLR